VIDDYHSITINCEENMETKNYISELIDRYLDQTLSDQELLRGLGDGLEEVARSYELDLNEDQLDIAEFLLRSILRARLGYDEDLESGLRRRLRYVNSKF
jgi:hypothetical protein